MPNSLTVCISKGRTRLNIGLSRTDGWSVEGPVYTKDKQTPGIKVNDYKQLVFATLLSSNLVP